MATASSQLSAGVDPFLPRRTARSGQIGPPLPRWGWIFAASDSVTVSLSLSAGTLPSPLHRTGSTGQSKTGALVIHTALPTATGDLSFGDQVWSILPMGRIG